MMKGWRRKGDLMIGVLDRQEAALVRGLVRQVREMLEVRAEEAPSVEDQNSAAALRSLHEPELLALKTGVAGVLLDTCPPGGGEIRLNDEQAAAWLSALNDVRLALGTALDVTEDMPDELPADDPREPHLNVYHWLTWV